MNFSLEGAPILDKHVSPKHHPDGFGFNLRDGQALSVEEIDVLMINSEILSQIARLSQVFGFVRINLGAFAIEDPHAEAHLRLYGFIRNSNNIDRPNAFPHADGNHFMLASLGSRPERTALAPRDHFAEIIWPALQEALNSATPESPLHTLIPQFKSDMETQMRSTSLLDDMHGANIFDKMMLKTADTLASYRTSFTPESYLEFYRKLNAALRARGALYENTWSTPHALFVGPKTIHHRVCDTVEQLESSINTVSIRPLVSIGTHAKSLAQNPYRSIAG